MQNKVFRSQAIERRLSRCLDIVQKGEIATVITTTGTGINRLIMAVCSESAWLGKLSAGYFINSKYLDLRSIELANINLEEIISISEINSEDERTLVVINGIEEVFNQKCEHLLMEIVELHRSRNLHLILISSQNLLAKSKFAKESMNISYYPVIEHYGLLTTQDRELYLEQMIALWDTRIDPTDKAKILEMTGGWMVLIKRLAWNYVMRDQSEVKSGELRVDTNWLIGTLWNNFGENEQKLLLDICFGREMSEVMTTELEYLIALGIVDRNKLAYQITVPILKSYIQRSVGNKYMNNEMFIVDGIEISNLTSIQIQIMKVLIESQGRIVSRDELAENVWHDTAVSDWAIDGQISRLRARLVQLGCQGEHILTKKKKGYIWQ